MSALSFYRDDGKCDSQTMTHHLVSRPWTAEGLFVAALVLFLVLCAPASESGGRSDGALWSASACAGVVASGSWTATSSAWETCGGDTLVFSKYMFSVGKICLGQGGDRVQHHTPCFSR